MRWCLNCEQYLPVSEFGTKGRKANGDVRFQPRCFPCMRVFENQRRERAALREPDPLGADPLMPIAPFRVWLERVIARRERMVGAGALEEIGALMAGRFGGTPDQWCRSIYRLRNEGSKVRLRTADELLLVLDFDGTSLDDLWPLDEEQAA